MMVVAGVVLLILMSYVVGLCYGLIILKASNIVPAYLIVISSMLALIFGMFKVGGIIFRKKGHEIISSLPLPKWAVVGSRFVRLYIENLAVTLIVKLPGMITYVILSAPVFFFIWLGY